MIIQIKPFLPDPLKILTFAVWLKCKNSLNFYKIPWLFPNIEKNNHSSTFPWPVRTLVQNHHFLYDAVTLSFEATILKS